MEYSGAGGKLIHEKNQKKKISWHCPFKLSAVPLNYINPNLYKTFWANDDGMTTDQIRYGLDELGQISWIPLFPHQREGERGDWFESR
jgi:hypothetical protein